MGCVIVHEEQEDGVSGHKVRAENRDKIQAIKELAKQGKCSSTGSHRGAYLLRLLQQVLQQLSHDLWTVKIHVHSRD